MLDRMAGQRIRRANAPDILNRSQERNPEQSCQSSRHYRPIEIWQQLTHRPSV